MDPPQLQDSSPNQTHVQIVQIEGYATVNVIC